MKWKLGEQQAAQRLEAADRVLMLPVLELVKIKDGGLYKTLAPTLAKTGIAAKPVGLDPKLLLPAGVTFAALMKLCHSAQKDGFTEDSPELRSAMRTAWRMELGPDEPWQMIAMPRIPRRGAPPYSE